MTYFFFQILYGQSIGGAVAIDLASRNPSTVSFRLRLVLFLPDFFVEIRALILENTFTSLPALIPSALPILSPFAFLCHQKWESALKIPLIPRSTPMLLLSGLRDEVVPSKHMKALWEVVGRRQGVKAPEGDGEAKGDGQVGQGRSKFVEFPHGTHSEYRMYRFTRLALTYRVLDDTCVQEDYWTTVEEFVKSLEVPASSSRL